VTAPVPEPPLEVSVSVVPTVPLVEASVSVAWALGGAGANVTVVAGELAARYVASAALVTVTAQVPAWVASNSPPEIKQLAVPELVMA
jgi:hypothetical protein